MKSNGPREVGEALVGRACSLPPRGRPPAWRQSPYCQLLVPPLPRPAPAPAKAPPRPAAAWLRLKRTRDVDGVLPPVAAAPPPAVVACCWRWGSDGGGEGVACGGAWAAWPTAGATWSWAYLQADRGQVSPRQAYSHTPAGVSHSASEL